MPAARHRRRGRPAPAPAGPPPAADAAGAGGSWRRRPPAHCHRHPSPTRWGGPGAAGGRCPPARSDGPAVSPARSGHPYPPRTARRRGWWPTTAGR
ncbi:hypothetical protein G6F23_014282 [Rhizopus arrhizus]|nr:hypothetical protein G6F23_014282 [Rhizopus arrhizus]